MKYKVALMKQLRAFKGTTIVVLHDLNLAAQYCDHIVIMNKGTILKEGSPTEVLTPEILEPIFEVPFKTSWDEGRDVYKRQHQYELENHGHSKQLERHHKIDQTSSH